MEVPHPIDVNYGLLNAKLKLLSPKSEEYKVSLQFFEKWYVHCDGSCVNGCELFGEHIHVLNFHTCDSGVHFKIKEKPYLLSLLVNILFTYCSLSFFFLVFFF